MSDDVADVSMPEGIEVDEAAAYFGVFESSDALHEMMQMSREDAFEKFFLLLSDLVLKPGDFDFELASERLNCEGGEIYFLVAGHLGVMTLPEQLALAISDGQFSDDESSQLQEIADPMRLLKLFAIAQQTGGAGEATKYLKGVESLMLNPAANKEALLSLSSEIRAAFDVAGHVTPIASLASNTAEAKQVETAYVPPTPVEAEEIIQQPISKPEPASVPEPSPEPEVVVEAVIEPAQVSVPLPAQEKAVPLPAVEKPLVPVDDRKESEKTDDAFAGAFGFIQPEAVVTDEVQVIPEPEVQPEPLETEESEQEPSLDDAFAAADTDNSGGLSVEEVVEATGLGLEEAAKLHEEADIDGDGEVTLEELKSKPEVIEKMALPKPVKPVRAGIQQRQQPPVQQQMQAQQQQWQIQQQQQQWQAQQQQQQWQAQQQQQQWQAQQQQQQWQAQQQQRQWNQPAQPMQPTIRSGLHCRGCRIGVDPNWRFCPVCGTQNR